MPHLEAQHTINDHIAGIYALCLGPDGTLLSGSADKHVVAWDSETGEQSGFAAKLNQAVYALDYLSEHRQLLVGNSHGGFHVLDLDAGKELRLLQVHKRGIFGFQKLPGQRLAVTGGDGSVSFWDAPTLNLIRHIPLSGKKLKKIILLNNATIAVADSAGPIHLLDAESFNPAGQLAGHHNGSNCLAMHPSKNVLISGGRDAHLRIWDTETSREMHAVAAHNFSIYDMAFSPDGKWLATASFDKTVKLWNADTMELVQRIERPDPAAHRASVNALVWLDNQRLVTAGDDKRITFWKLIP